jgi:ribosomal protein S12 methylthiotransferase
MSKNNRIGFISLGCPKALVDSERIITQLQTEGYEIVPDYTNANLVVVNTCGFIDSAVDESLQAIGEALDENGQVIVTGCLGERANIVQEKYPNVLAVTGAHAYSAVMDAVHQHLPPEHDPYTSLVPPQGVKLTPKHYAFLKISEGCNHQCSFCIIPDLRGKLDSRPVASVLQEAEQLVQAGTKELLIISQDTSAYGVDLKYRTDIYQNRAVKTQLFDLVKNLSDLDVWVRLHYIYPYPHVDKIIPLLAEGKILPYLDIPFQHSSPTVLKNMKRPAASENVIKRIQQWRSDCPELSLRSTFIVGFPGETEEDFQHLLDFLEQAQLDRVGCFEYSAVDGAKANALPNHVPDEVKKERWQRFMAVQNKISEKKLQQKIGYTLQVLVDKIDDQGAICRSYADAPDIDGCVFVDDPTGLQVGEFAQVEIVGSAEYDLWGEVV